MRNGFIDGLLAAAKRRERRAKRPAGAATRKTANENERPEVKDPKPGTIPH